MKRKPPTVADYLAAVDEDKRAALVKLRKVIRAAAPEAEECIAYGMPAYRVRGRVTVAFGTGRNHCAFYAGSTPLEKYKRELARYETRKGTVRFQADSPLPATLVRKLVRAQIAARAR
jgi:uncharacterized protein YdhG (YjbR/CyaY superfamily)